MTGNLISICIPTYNGAGFLKETLDSIKNQSLKIFEVIICDDNSTDNTVEIVKSYIGRIPIHFYKNPVNLGLVKNWNKCIEHANGEWIKFLFQDDIMESDCIEKLQPYLSSEYNFLIYNRSFIVEDKNEKYAQTYDSNLSTIDDIFIKNRLFSCEESVEIIYKYFNKNIFGEPSNTLIRKNCFFNIGMFNSSYIQLCDYEFWLRIISNYGFYYISDVLGKFRVHKSSTSAFNHQNNLTFINYVEPVMLCYEFLFNIYYSNLRNSIYFSYEFFIEKIDSFVLYMANNKLPLSKIPQEYSTIITLFELEKVYKKIQRSYFRKGVKNIVKIKKKLF